MLGVTTPVAYAPVADPQQITVSTAIIIVLTGYDANGTALSFEIVGSPARGVLGSVNGSTGNVTYTPPADLSGSDSFSFSVTSGVITSEPATVTILLAPGPQYLLTTAANPPNGGPVTPSSGNFNAGTVVPLTATPNAGYVFSSWSGPVANPSSASTTVTMNAAESVTANFNPLVPNVVGQTQAAATTAIVGLGLVVGTVTTSPSSTVPSGGVISESPLAGTPVSPGSAVNLVISGSAPLRFVPVTPCRIVDTRNPNGAFGGPELGGGSTRNFLVPNSSCGIPSTALAYSLNVTVVPDGGLSYLTIWPAGQTQPLVSTLNSDGRIKANAAIVPAGSSGGVAVYVTDSTHVVLDINGYFVSGNSSALDFYPLTPCRIADTRLANGPLGAPYLSGGVARSFPILASSCNIPSSAQAYSLNFTAIPHSALSYLSTWPAGRTQPVVSTLNSRGAVTANAAIVPAGTSGAVNVYATDDSDLVIDVNGYFAPQGAGGLSLYNVTPCRILDTRVSGGQFKGTIATNVTASLCGVSSSAQAYVVNATVVPAGGLSYLTLWPTGQPQPVVSTLNSDGSVTSNMAIVPTLNGSVTSYATDPTQLILDISAYFAP